MIYIEEFFFVSIILAFSMAETIEVVVERKQVDYSQLCFQHKCRLAETDPLPDSCATMLAVPLTTNLFVFCFRTTRNSHYPEWTRERRDKPETTE